MVKRILSTVLCICLLLPFVSVANIQATAEEETGGYILRDLGLRFLHNLTLNKAGIFVSRGTLIEPLDIKNLYGDDLDRIAIQMDTYLSGDEKFIEYMMGNNLQGQCEITSGGKCDVEELGITCGDAFTFTPGKWNRITIPLSAFTTKTGGEFNTAAFNYVRIYISENAAQEYHGGKGTFKLCNLYIVDTAQEPPSEEEIPIGDGTFTTEEPVYRKMEVGAAYDNSSPVYAGYNLKEYLDTHSEVRVINKEGEKTTLLPSIRCCRDWPRQAAVRCSSLRANGIAAASWTCPTAPPSSANGPTPTRVRQRAAPF